MYDEIIKCAEGICRTYFANDISLQFGDVIYGYEGAPSTILRCTLRPSQDELPTSVVVKRLRRQDDGLRYDAAGLAFVTEIMPQLVPICYGLHDEQQILVMEYLLYPQSDLLGNILFERDAAYAEAALIAFQQTVARLQCASMPHEDRFLAYRAHYQNPQEVSRHRINHIADALDALADNLRLIGGTVDITDDIAAIQQMIASPAEFNALVHGDTTPANAFYDGSTFRLFDFETSDFRHALLDGSYARLRYLHSVWARQIPLAVQQRVMAAYKAEFLAHSTVDTDIFDQQLVACSAGWLAGLCMFMPQVLEQDKKWGRSTNRQRIVAGLEHFAWLATENAYFPDLKRACLAAQTRLKEQWSEADCTMLIYPAFS